MDRRIARAMDLGYGLVPLLAGGDKFTGLLADWDRYLSKRVAKRLPVSSRTFMKAVGAVEMAVGALALVPRTRRIGALLAAGWLGSIAIQMMLHEKKHLDIAARDALLAVGALAVASNARAELKIGKRQILEADEPLSALNDALPEMASHIEH